MSKKLSKELMEIPSVPLAAIGVNGKAYLRNDAIKIVSYARQNIIPVLGGDVYYKSKYDHDIHITYDNWYCNREEFESLKDYVERSCDAAEHFIINYISKNGIDPLFYIVLEEEWL